MIYEGIDGIWPATESTSLENKKKPNQQFQHYCLCWDY